MGLRNFFASVGFCESTEELARRPDLIARILDYSRPYTDLVAKNDPGYEERLITALDTASTYALSRLLEENVMVGMDHRLSQLDTGFWSSEILSVYYDQGHQKLLCLYDNGKLPGQNGFFETGITDRSDDAINELITDVLDRGCSDDLLLGTTHSTGKTTYFDWDRSGDFSYELSRNPDLLTSPLVTDQRKRAPQATPLVSYR